MQTAGFWLLFVLTIIVAVGFFRLADELYRIRRLLEPMATYLSELRHNVSFIATRLSALDNNVSSLRDELRDRNN